MKLQKTFTNYLIDRIATWEAKWEVESDWSNDEIVSLLEILLQKDLIPITDIEWVVEAIDRQTFGDSINLATDVSVKKFLALVSKGDIAILSCYYCYLVKVHSFDVDRLITLDVLNNSSIWPKKPIRNKDALSMLSTIFLK